VRARVDDWPWRRRKKGRGARNAVLLETAIEAKQETAANPFVTFATFCLNFLFPFCEIDVCGRGSTIALEGGAKEAEEPGI
jgi:hypothetical protein